MLIVNLTYQFAKTVNSTIPIPGGFASGFGTFEHGRFQIETLRWIDNFSTESIQEILFVDVNGFVINTQV